MFEISQARVIDAYNVANRIPEFSQGHYSLKEYEKRLGIGSYILVGYCGGIPAGFKVGYPRGAEGSFYSWMGGVLPDYRRSGLAQKLADQQEHWAKAQGYTEIWFKTRNRNRAMIIFALNNGFSITEVQPKQHIMDHRILMKKSL